MAEKGCLFLLIPPSTLSFACVYVCGFMIYLPIPGGLDSERTKMGEGIKTDEERERERERDGGSEVSHPSRGKSR